jgi:hypothetical protein
VHRWVEMVLMDGECPSKTQAGFPLSLVAGSVSLWVARSVASIVPPNPSIPPHAAQNSQITYTGELDAAVAALGSSAALLDVKETQRAAGSLNNPRQVRRGVVTARKARVSQFRPPTRCVYRFSIDASEIKTEQLTGSGDGR